MSRKGVRPRRRQVTLDRYYTPAWCVDQLVEHVLPDLDDGAQILEPAAGQGAIVRGLRRRYPRAVIGAIDLDDVTCDDAGADYSIGGVDFLADTTQGERIDLACTNPPFYCARPFVEEMRRCASITIALVRLGFLSSQKRAEWLRASPPSSIWIMANRPAFKVPADYFEEYAGAGGDSADYCWIVFDDREPFAQTVTRWLPAVTK